MDYEKKYKNALEWARQVMNGETGFIRKEVEEVFPELKESEDEKIRKEIISALKNANYKGVYGKHLAWLKKQGEQKVSVADFKAKDWYISKVDGKIHNIYHSADKVEPKFKVGDWVANDYCVGKVIAITDDAYLLDTGQGIPFSYEHNAHLWTIQDAKEGDVLVDVYGNIGIFEKRHGINWHTYCYLGNEGRLVLEGGSHGSICYPATKEQRDTLIKAMTDAEYTFDFEKKELKKIKSIPSWSEEDDRLLRVCMATINGIDYFCPENKQELTDWLKSLKERNTWKPSDEQIELLEMLVEDNNQRYFYTTLNSLYEQLKKLR